MFTSAIKKQTSVVMFYFIISLYGWYLISNLKMWNHGKKEKGKQLFC